MGDSSVLSYELFTLVTDEPKVPLTINQIKAAREKAVTDRGWGYTYFGGEGLHFYPKSKEFHDGGDLTIEQVLAIIDIIEEK